MRLLDPATLNSIAFRWDTEQQQFVETTLGALSFSVMDLGAMHGAILVERLRTFGGQIRQWNEHADRLSLGARALGVPLPWDSQELRVSCERLIARNREQVQGSLVRGMSRDMSVVILVSPGNAELGLGQCNTMLHVLPLPWERLRTWYTQGTRLRQSPWMNGAGQCWPAELKARSRLNYFLSDRLNPGEELASLGLLGTAQGTVADTSVANVVLVTRDGDWITPSAEDVLAGTSLRFSQRLLADHGLDLEYRDIEFDELADATEVLLVGNSGCVWHAQSLDGLRIADGLPGIGCRQLQRWWCERIGFDWLEDALRA